jgi:anti-anti-sigma factor
MQTENTGAALLVRLGSDYGSANKRALDELEVLLRRATSEITPGNVILNFNETEYIGARFVNILVQASNELRRGNRRLTLVGLREPLFGVLRICKLDERFAPNHGHSKH